MPNNPDLAALSAAATQEDLCPDEGHYFIDTLWDLANCSHGETAYFNNRHDGPFIAALWNEYRAGRLVQIDEGMRERVARAIDHELVWSVETDVLASSLTREEQLKVADAAIAAMGGAK